VDVSHLCLGLDEYDESLILLREALSNEALVLYDGDIFAFNKSRSGYYVNTNPNRRSYRANNITVNFGRVIDSGFDKIAEDIYLRKASANEEQKRYYTILLDIIGCICDFASRYRQKALQMGFDGIAAALEQIPRKGARTFYEACMFQKLIIYVLREQRHDHITLGRFDQYMYRYYENDIKNGKSEEELLEILEMYFISLNLDTDTYFGIQQGDNGQSLVLGGFDLDGNYNFNGLSRLCMEASLELELIDPKINIRVGKNTDDGIYALGTRLTKKGLGFPQYCNDDIVIPGLIALGYEPKDAANYSVAACWEFIIPNKSLDIPNVRTFNFPLVINNAIHKGLLLSDTFDDLMRIVDSHIEKECDAIVASCYGKENFGYSRGLKRAPVLSIFVDGCIENGRDISDFAARYYNHGCHGAGISNGADALAAVKKVIYEEGSVDKKELLAALDADFEGYTPLRNKLLSCPKTGNDDDFADGIMLHIMSTFSKCINGRPNGVGGVWRAGTGSAMEYILSARKCPATADGRLNAAPYGSSFSPAITTRLKGPLSVISSFTKPDLSKVINGGPLTMEINSNVFRNEEGDAKVANLVKMFVKMGGHQLQLNSVSKEKLLDAREHPEKYPNLIVRVWGWSGYFCELDKEYQDHIISRTDFSF
jgi:formate C-acetyltransferase